MLYGQYRFRRPVVAAAIAVLAGLAAAWRALEAYEGERVRLERRGRDRYGRTLARVHAQDGRPLAEVVREALDGAPDPALADRGSGP